MGSTKLMTKKKVTVAKNAKSTNGTSPHDHSPELKRISRVKGQLDGVERMILDRRYCPEIVIQIKAVRSALRSLECSIVEGHMHHCVKAAMKSKDPKIINEKLEEIVLLMRGQGY